MFYIAAIMACFYIALLLRELNVIKKRERVKYHTGKIKMPPKEGDDLPHFFRLYKRNRLLFFLILLSDDF
ncbi:hypothetical protein [Photobacterium leiognathi]|uniref:Uncharacterized protein n=1 Tax=Photobacterium leiognathi TaxID=553611 RepID=A0A2T3M7F9_PHOLE|nr:hypothetical protein [Photobacterium leiognathi]KJF97102.1 hypothetical protein UB34_14680 [Photobacterium leiognathi]PSV88135.1 hypothetical protein CTM89_15260 [Photobacterium leiognathi]